MDDNFIAGNSSAYEEMTSPLSVKTTARELVVP